MAERQLNLYLTFQFTAQFWELDASKQSQVKKDLVQSLGQNSGTFQLYRAFPSRPDTDILIWSAWKFEETNQPGEFLSSWGNALDKFRKYLLPVQSLWGFTRVSQYARGKSEQDIDPFDADRSPYFVVYPFSKTKEWYLMSMDARQGQMNEHIKLGKEYPAIKQLLIYSFGIQDQEFVVAYETDDLPLFSELVNKLRNTEARRHTLLDTPLITGFFLSKEDFVR